VGTLQLYIRFPDESARIFILKSPVRRNVNILTQGMLKGKNIVLKRAFIKVQFSEINKQGVGR
jgi:hypothetical protein